MRNKKTLQRATAVALLGLVTVALAAACGSNSSSGSTPHPDSGTLPPQPPPPPPAPPPPPPAPPPVDGGDAGCVGTCTIPFASDITWPSFSGDSMGGDASTTGNAKDVCYNASSPPSCPADAVVYGFAGTAAQEDLSSIPGAHWIWRGDVTAGGQADLQVAIFKKTFTLGASPTGTIQIAADDYADVRVNGVSVGTIGSVSDPGIAGTANSSLHMFDLSAQLHAGDNTLEIIAQNGPASFASCATTCTYAENPATVVFGGSLSYH